MSWRDRLRLLAVEETPQAKFLKAQEASDAEKLRVATKAENLVVMADARQKAAVFRENTRHALSSNQRERFEGWVNAVASATGMPVFVFRLLSIVVCVLVALAAYPMTGMWATHTVEGYTIELGNTTEMTESQYQVVYRPKGADGPDSVWVPETTQGRAQAEFEKLLAAYGDVYDFRLASGAKAFCWKVVQMVKYEDDHSVSPCYTDYSSAVAVYTAFQNGNLGSLSRDVLDVYGAPQEPLVAPLATKPAPMASVAVQGEVVHDTTVVVVPDYLASEYFDLYPVAEEVDDSYLDGIAPGEVVLVSGYK